MRDTSASYWFQAGDAVRVSSDQVCKAGTNLHGRIGVVRETWEKCDVDPTCCCAEQVDRHMAVRVEFDGSEDDAASPGCSFTHYFAEDELVKVPVDRDDPVAFDGMSCKEFKLGQLQLDSQKRGLSSFDPTPLSTEH